MDRTADRQIREHYRQEIEKAQAQHVIEASRRVIEERLGCNRRPRPKKGKGSKKVRTQLQTIVR